MEDQYNQSCNGDFQAGKCEAFFRNVSRSGLLHLWILDPSGRVIRSLEKRPPDISQSEIRQAAGGEVVTSMERRHAPQVLLPMRNQAGKVVSLLVLERTFLRGRHFPRFPLVFSLLIAGAVIALLVLPLAFRISRPIRELHGLGKEWAEGHLQKRAQVTGKDEIADLATVFNTMAGNLQSILQQRKEFLALISHELKSPLARMKLALELLSEKGADPSLIQSMQSDISESEKLVEQLLILSKIEMEIPAVNFEPLQVSMIMQKAIEQLNTMARSAGVEILFQPPTQDLPQIHGDAAQLQRAFANILENAVKFSTPGSKVEVQFQAVSKNVKIAIADHGSGLEPGEQEKIFEPFYRSKAAQNKEGSGLGLFIARRIIESHGGKISAAPNHPTGVILTIELPF
jgi:two-component system OmpR family sensor kinase